MHNLTKLHNTVNKKTFTKHVKTEPRYKNTKIQYKNTWTRQKYKTKPVQTCTNIVIIIIMPKTWNIIRRRRTIINNEPRCVTMWGYKNNITTSFMNNNKTTGTPACLYNNKQNHVYNNTKQKIMIYETTIYKKLFIFIYSWSCCVNKHRCMSVRVIRRE